MVRRKIGRFEIGIEKVCHCCNKKYISYTRKTKLCDKCYYNIIKYKKYKNTEYGREILTKDA